MCKKQWTALLAALLVLVCMGCDASPAPEGAEVQALPAESAEPERTYAPPAMQGEITVSVLEEDERLIQAAAVFKGRYPDVTVTVDAFRVPEYVMREGGYVRERVDPAEGQTDADYLTLLNTQIMSDSAADILITDALPFRRYAEMGVFEDLSFYLEHSPEISETTHFMGVIDATRDSRGRLFEIPLAFGLPMVGFDVMMVEQTDLWLPEGQRNISFRDAAAYGKQLIDQSEGENQFLIKQDTLELPSAYVYRLMLDDPEPILDFENRRADFTGEAFRALLEETSALAEQGYFDLEGVIDPLDFVNYVPYSYGLLLDATRFYTWGDTVLSGDENDRRTQFRPLGDAQGRVHLAPGMRVALNAAGENPDLAWEFIKFLLSDEWQTRPQVGPDLPGVNRKGFDVFMRDYIGTINEYTEAPTDEDAYMETVSGWVNQTWHYVRVEPIVIQQFLLPELDAYFNGQQDAETAARNIQTKVEQYFNE
jgi:multiple sugar transport system substrate-binding protein